MQRSLFDTDPAPWEVDAEANRLMATVVLASGFDKPLDYLVPENFSDPRHRDILAEPGRRVRVPLGRGDRPVVGYCVEVGVKPVEGRRLKSVSAVLDSEAILSPAMLRLTRWMADYYLCPWGQAIEAVVPAGVRARSGTREVLLLSVPTEVAARLALLKLTPTQQRVLESLATSAKPLAVKQLMQRAECTAAPINALRKAGLIAERTERVDVGDRLAMDVPREPEKPLEPDQQRALAAIEGAIDSGAHRTLLLHGVTGSGKTEVYLRAASKVVAAGKQAIVLVPEISLTPQTVRRFAARFDRIAVLHSHQSDVERRSHWRRIAAGEVQVVVGARSAVFAPTRRLGLIVIDEEHEGTFKQDVAPRYHARTVALHRASQEGVPVVLASATPSLDAWWRTQTGEYELLEMPKRVADRPMPDVCTIDLKAERRPGARGAISRVLGQAMSAALREGGQVILLLNRRGFSTHIQCPACGFALKCPECEIALTFHKAEHVALCHWCDLRAEPPAVCPDCKNPGILYLGYGTQKLEDEVRARFPDYRCLRMDADTMRRPGSHDRTLEEFRRGEAQILLGTQMIAKGLDFADVTLVGVVNADTAINLPDFRAAERTFQLVTQVAGRTGRGERGGRVYVQTVDPDHPAIAAAVRHDFARFAQGELPERKALLYPPFGSMARIVARGENPAAVAALLEAAADAVRSAAGERDVRVSGPAEAPVGKLQGKHRHHLLIRAAEIDLVREVAAAAMGALTPPADVQWIVDIDPQDML